MANRVGKAECDGASSVDSSSISLRDEGLYCVCLYLEGVQVSVRKFSKNLNDKTLMN